MTLKRYWHRRQSIMANARQALWGTSPLTVFVKDSTPLSFADLNEQLKAIRNEAAAHKVMLLNIDDIKIVPFPLTYNPVKKL